MKKDEAQPKKIIKMILTSYSQAHERLFRKRIGRNTPQHAAILNENAQSHLGTLQFRVGNAQSHLGTMQFRGENAQSHLGTLQFWGFGRRAQVVT